MIPIVAIDGPSGSGKGTIAKLLALDLGWNYLDSGLIYRCYAYLLKNKIKDIKEVFFAGGSTRIPAAWCGLVGFKPSRGRIPTGPKLSYSFLSVGGLITKSIRDQRMIYSSIWDGQYTNSWIPPVNRKPVNVDREGQD